MSWRVCLTASKSNHSSIELVAFDALKSKRVAAGKAAVIQLDFDAAGAIDNLRCVQVRFFGLPVD
jgi:hypothetical protein